MLSDNGGAYRSALMTATRAKFGVEARFTSPYHPQSNGLCERTNGVITNVVAKIVGAGKEAEWAEHLALAVFDYNTKPHSATRRTPYEVVYGRPCHTWVAAKLREVGRGPGGGTGESPARKRLWEEGGDEEEAARLEARREDVRDAAQTAQARQTARNVRDYNKRHRVAAAVINAGDAVMKTDLNFSRNIGKGNLAPKYEGPFDVVSATQRTACIRTRQGELLRGVPLRLLKKVDAGGGEES